MRRTHLLPLLILATFSVAGCNRPATAELDHGEPSNTANPATQAASSVSQADVAGLGPVQALALANDWMGNGVTTYVTTEKVVFEFADGEKTSVQLPADEMIVAIAPFITRTHPCEVHYMSGCQGELVGVPVVVEARLADGTVIVDDTIRTMRNGFLELWLPRDVEISITMTAQGKTVTGSIGTFATSNTCITTLQLT